MNIFIYLGSVIYSGDDLTPRRSTPHATKTNKAKAKKAHKNKKAEGQKTKQKANYKKTANLQERAHRLAKAQKARKEAKEATEKARETQQEVIRIVNDTLSNDKFVEFLTSNVGRYAIEVIKRLDKPKTDDVLATELNVKINEVRRVLNLLGGYGVARYDTNKDSKGWLTFSWYIDTQKLSELKQSVTAEEQHTELSLPGECDDFFVCEKCYDTNKIVLPFDAAFEHSFKCPECGRPLKRLSKEEAEDLLAEKEKLI